MLLNLPGASSGQTQPIQIRPSLTRSIEKKASLHATASRGRAPLAAHLPFTAKLPVCSLLEHLGRIIIIVIVIHLDGPHPAGHLAVRTGRNGVRQGIVAPAPEIPGRLPGQSTEGELPNQDLASQHR